MGATASMPEPSSGDQPLGWLHYSSPSSAASGPPDNAQHRESTSSAAGGSGIEEAEREITEPISSPSSQRTRLSSTCPTPPRLQEREHDDGCRVLRRTLGATHKVCKRKPRHIEALSQSLGKVAGRHGPDGGLAAYVQNFDNSVMDLYRRLSASYKPHVLHSSGPPPLNLKAFSDSLGRLTVDLEKWCTDFETLVFPNLAATTADSGSTGRGGRRRTSARKLKTKAKALRERCFAVAGKLDALSYMDPGYDGTEITGTGAGTNGTHTHAHDHSTGRRPSREPASPSIDPLSSAVVSNSAGRTPPPPPSPAAERSALPSVEVGVGGSS